MRAVWTLLFASLVSGCGGNWSTRDLEFANALPQRADLAAKLPASSVSQPLQGVSTRRDPLGVGDPSKAWADTTKASGDFNRLLDQILGLLDAVRQLPPTTRSASGRVWGPVADANNPGFDVQVSITQVDETNFAWAIQSRPRGGDFFDVITGTFSASRSAREGQGQIVVHAKDFRDRLKVDANLQSLDQIDIGYLTDSWPHRVEMLFTFKPGSPHGLSAIGYTYRQQQDTSGQLHFQVRTTSTDTTVLETTSAWTPQGAGRAQSAVTEGLYTGATVSECWDSAFTVRYYAESWTGGEQSGVETDCPTIPGL